MARYHVNPHTGDYGVCHADKGKCPFGGPSGTENHYSNEAEAKRASEAIHKKSAIRLSRASQSNAPTPKTTNQSYLDKEGVGEITKLVDRYDEMFKGYDPKEVSETVKEAVAELTAEWGKQRDDLQNVITEARSEQADYIEKLHREIDERNERNNKEAQALLDATKDINSNEDLSEWASGKTMRPSDFVKPGGYLRTVAERNPGVDQEMEILGLKEYTYRGKSRIAITARDLEYGDTEKFTFPAELAGVNAFKSNQQNIIDNPRSYPTAQDLRWDATYHDLSNKELYAGMNVGKLNDQLENLGDCGDSVMADVKQSYQDYQNLKKNLELVSHMKTVSDEEAEAWLKATGRWPTELDVLAAGDGKVLVMTHTDKYAYYSDDARVSDYFTYSVIDEDGNSTPITKPVTASLTYYDSLEDCLRKTYHVPPITTCSDKKSVKDLIASRATLKI